MHKNAIIISSSDDIKKLSFADHMDVLSLDYSLSIGNEKIKYFYINNIPNYINLPIKLARCWYRDNQGNDLSEKYSYGLMLEKRISFTITNALKLYFSLKYHSNDYNLITLPYNLPYWALTIAHLFSDKVDISDDVKCSETILQYYNDRAAIKKIPCKSVSRILRLVQSLFNKYIKGRTMMFPDWTYDNERHKNYLYQNAKNIFNGFYFINDRSSNLIDNHIININHINIKNILKSFSISGKTSSDIIQIITTIINNEYNDNIDAINQNYDVLNDLFNFYKPSKIIVPDDGQYPWYNMCIQLSNIKGFDHYSVLDGYMTYVNPDEIKIQNSPTDTLVKNFVTMGTVNDELIKHHIPQFKRYMIKPPLSAWYTNSKCHKQFDLLIMMPVAHPHNLHSRWDMRTQYINDVLDIIKDMNISNIGIKIKAGLGDNLCDIEKQIITRDCRNISIIDKPSFKVLNHARCIVGQLGTTLLEASLLEIPYYIFEPVYCGLSIDDVENSIVSEEFVARSIKQLEKNIHSDRYVLFKKDKINNGFNLNMVIN